MAVARYGERMSVSGQGTEAIDTKEKEAHRESV